MRTSELTGALLDYWVARAEGHTVVPGVVEIQDKLGNWKAYQPSTDWAHGGPIIAKNAIAFAGEPGGSEGNGQWCAYFSDGPDAWEGRGDDHLTAAMRAVVARKFGDEVPDEIGSV